MITFDFHIDIPDTLADRLPEMQASLDTEFVRLADPYVPFDSGLLSQNVRGIGTGLIEYASPYAHYMYEGIVYGPSIPIFEEGVLVGFRSKKGATKYPTGRPINYNREKHPLAGPKWAERVVANHMTELKEAVVNAIRP